MGVTIKQIAQEVGLSWPAVSQILNNRGRFASATRERVIAVAARHGYRPNSSARALRQQSSRMVGVLFRNDSGNPLTNMAAFEYLLGINQRFQSADYGTLLIRAGELAAEGDVEPRVFRERLVDGVIVVGVLPDPLIDRVRRLAPRVVWLDGPVWEPTCCVRRDERAAGHACVDVMADLGYRRLTFVARDATRLGHHSHGSREEGARAAARERGVDIEVLSYPEQDAQVEYETLVAMTRRDVGLVASSQPIARRIAYGASGIGRSLGHDYGMVCCDDSFGTQTSWPGLGRVRFDRYGLGERAGELMLSLLATPDAPPASILQVEPWCPGCSAWGPLPGEPPAPLAERRAAKRTSSPSSSPAPAAVRSSGRTARA